MYYIIGKLNKITEMLKRFLLIDRRYISCMKHAYKCSLNYRHTTPTIN